MVVLKVVGAYICVVVPLLIYVLKPRRRSERRWFRRSSRKAA